VLVGVATPGNANPPTVSAQATAAADAHLSLSELMCSSRTSGWAAHASDRQVRSQSVKLRSHSACVMSFLVTLRPQPGFRTGAGGERCV